MKFFSKTTTITLSLCLLAGAINCGAHADGAFQVDVEDSGSGTATTTDKAHAPTPADSDVSTESLIYERAKVKTNNGDMTGAIADLDGLIQKAASKPRYLRERARAYHKLKNYDKAISDIDTAIEAEPKNSWAYDMRGQIEFSQGKFQAAVDDGTKAVSLEKNSKYAFRYYYNRGLAKQCLLQNEPAIEDFTASIGMNSTFEKSFSGRGLSYYRLKQNDKALADYDKAISLSQKNSAVFYNRSLIRTANSDYKGALEDLNKAVAIAPSDVKYLKERASVKDKMGDSKGSLADYDLAIKANQTNSDSGKTK